MTPVIPINIRNRAETNQEILSWVSSIHTHLDAMITRLGLVSVEQIASDWSIVLKAKTAESTELIIKAAPPDAEVVAASASLLNHHASLVECTHTDASNGIQILRYIPGELFPTDCNAPSELTRVGHLLRNLHELDIYPGMIPLSTWCRELLSANRLFPAAILENCIRCRDLLTSSPRDKWLHGDLHHGNIIENPETRALIAIDPKGLYGDPSFDICTFVRNHVPADLEDSELDGLLENRIQTISVAAEYPLERAYSWAAAGNALSLIWDWPDSEQSITEYNKHQLRILMHLNRLASRYGSL